MKVDLKKISSAGSSLMSSPTVIIALLIFSFEFKLSNFTRWIILLAIIAITSYRIRANSSRINLQTSSYFIFAICISYYIFYDRPARALQFLSYGYDNAFHFTLFRGFNETSWFPNVDLTNWFTDLEIFTKVPLGHYALMSFIYHPFTYVESNPTSSLIFYASSQIFSIFLLTWLVYRFISDSRKDEIKNKITNAVMSLTIVICLASTLLVNGFAPYFWSLIIILTWLNYETENPVGWHKNLTLSLSIYSIMMITPAPATFLFVPALILIVREFLLSKKTGIKKSLFLNMAPYILIGGLVLLSFVGSSAGLGWRQLLQSGGLQNINLITSTALVLITIFYLFYRKRKLSDDVLTLIIISGLFSVAALSALTIIHTGNLQYYAIKQIYILLFFASIYLVKVYSQSDFRIILSGTLVFLLLIPILNPNFFKGGYMGVLPRVMIHTLQSEYWETEPVNAVQILNVMGLEGQKSSICYVWRVTDGFQDLDLSSRWINSLKQKDMISESCFSAYWNNIQLSDSEFREMLRTKGSDFVILTGITNTQENEENIEYRVISRED